MHYVANNIIDIYEKEKRFEVRTLRNFRGDIECLSDAIVDSFCLRAIVLIRRDKFIKATANAELPDF